MRGCLNLVHEGWNVRRDHIGFEAAQFVLAASPIIDAGREDDVMRESSSFSTRRSSHSWSHRRDVETCALQCESPSLRLHETDLQHNSSAHCASFSTSPRLRLLPSRAPSLAHRPGRYSCRTGMRTTGARARTSNERLTAEGTASCGFPLDQIFALLETEGACKLGLHSELGCEARARVRVRGALEPPILHRCLRLIAARC
ncbi:hypothetical protein B0H13DRAFT_2320568 [Mycena leptocephala]|nr:hypothetical protein B0H13DRAFT_2320568 [Mycena leptocephala]